MRTRHDQLVDELCDAGFLVTYHSTAVTLLVHPGYPGLEARIGTAMVVVERDGHEVFRAPLREFEASDLRQAIRTRIERTEI